MNSAAQDKNPARLFLCKHYFSPRQNPLICPQVCGFSRARHAMPLLRFEKNFAGVLTFSILVCILRTAIFHDSLLSLGCAGLRSCAVFYGVNSSKRKRAALTGALYLSASQVPSELPVAPLSRQYMDFSSFLEMCAVKSSLN
jgi:hypothetical protein